MRQVGIVAVAMDAVDLEFSGELWFWRGPAPWYFVTVPDQLCRELQDASSSVSYGWGMIPVEAQVGRSVWETSLFPKDGRYIVPVRANIRRAENLEEGDTISVQLTLRGAR
jgi:hypothetical protein